MTHCVPCDTVAASEVRSTLESAETDCQPSSMMRKRAGVPPRERLARGHGGGRDGQTDGQTDGWTDGRTDGRMEGGSKVSVLMPPLRKFRLLRILFT